VWVTATSGADLEALKRTAHEVAAEWGLEVGPPFAMSNYSYVAPVPAVDAVLKVVPLDDDEADEESDALTLWAGDGAVRLLRHDRERRAMLLERADPGTDLSTLADDDATAIAIDVGRRLWRPAGAPFRWIGDHVPRWLDAAEARNGNELVPLARLLLATLDVGDATLVHGDFHHHNVLAYGNRFVAIDPKPMRGEPEFDIPSFLWNPLDHRMTVEGTETRIAAFVRAGLDERRIRAWTVIRGAYLRQDDRDVVAVLRSLV
jgi:streptomycin 6-kinase